MNSSLRDPKLAQALGETRLGRVLINAHGVIPHDPPA